MQIALYARALALEYSRQREVALFYEKLFELEQHHELIAIAENKRSSANYFYRKLLAPVLTRSLLDRFKKINFLVFPFPGNLQVSCAGAFSVDVTNYKSIIAYNLVSYPDMSFLSLTARKSRYDYIDVFLNGYRGILELERLVNDIAFLKGEEPLISPRLWNSMSDTARMKIAKSLVHPSFRKMNNSVDFIKLPKDVRVKMQDRNFFLRIGMDEELVSRIIQQLSAGNLP